MENKISKELDIRTIINDVTKNYFETMLEIKLNSINNSENHSAYSHNYISCVHFSGETINGMLELRLSHDYGKMMAAKILSVDEDEIESIDDVMGILQESANIIGGNFKSQLCNLGHICRITPPMVFDIKAYKTSSEDWVTDECFVFNFREHYMVIKIYLTI